MGQSIIQALHTVFDILGQTVTPTPTPVPGGPIPENVNPWLVVITGALGIIGTVGGSIGSWITAYKKGLRERPNSPDAEVSHAIRYRIQSGERILTVQHTTQNTGPVGITIPYVVFRIQRKAPLDKSKLVPDPNTGKIPYPMIEGRVARPAEGTVLAFLEPGKDERDVAEQDFILPGDVTEVRVYTWLPDLTENNLGWWSASDFDLNTNKIVRFDSSDTPPTPDADAAA